MVDQLPNYREREPMPQLKTQDKMFFRDQILLDHQDYCFLLDDALTIHLSRMLT